MTVQYSIPVNQARLDSIETAIGTAPKLRIYTGSAPAACSTAATGTLLVEITLPSDWLAAATNAAPSVKSKSGVWSGTGAAAGTAGYWRVYDSAGTTCGMQGTAGTSGTDMTLDNTSIASGQSVTVNSFSITTAAANS
jgi:hypothetical protein